MIRTMGLILMISLLLAAPLAAAEAPADVPLELQSEAELAKKKQAIEFYFMTNQYNAINAELARRKAEAEKKAPSAGSGQSAKEKK